MPPIHIPTQLLLSLPLRREGTLQPQDYHTSKKKQLNTNNLNYSWKLYGKKYSQACLLPHQQDRRDLLGEEGHCPSSCPDLCTLKKLNSPRKAQWRKWRIYNLYISPIKDHQTCAVSSGQNERAMCWRYQECHPACSVHKSGETLEMILLKAGSVSKLLYPV